LAVVPALDLATELGRHGHLAVADAEHGHAGIEDRLRRARRARLMHGFRSARKDHALGAHFLECSLGFLKRDDLAIDALLADAAGNQLGHLTAEVDNQNLFMRRGHVGQRMLGFLCGCHAEEVRAWGRTRNRGKSGTHILLWAWTNPYMSV